MKHSKNIGIFCGITGLTLGIYFGVLPNLAYLNSSGMSGHQTGLLHASVATILGVSVAIASAIYHYSSKNT
jgi:hypothetical protein